MVVSDITPDKQGKRKAEVKVQGEQIMTDLNGLVQRAADAKKETISIREKLEAAHKTPETLDFKAMDARIMKLKKSIDA